MLTISLSHWGTLEKLWGGGGAVAYRLKPVSQTKICDFCPPQLFQTCIKLIPDKIESQ